MNAMAETVRHQISFRRGHAAYRPRSRSPVPVPVMPSFQQVIESCACPIVIISSVAQEQLLVYASPAFLELSGYDLEEIAGKDWTGIFASGSPDSILEPFRAAIGGAFPHQAVLQAHHKNGGTLYLDLKLTPLPGDGGAVTHCAAVVNDVTAERRRREMLEYRAYHDQLTGLGNRHLLQDRFELACAQARRSGEGFALALLDLNGFKQVNDCFGHEAGDALLRSVSALLKSAVRDGDTVARVGGDEFVLLMPETGAMESAEMVVGRVHASLSTPIRFQNASLHVSCCAGLGLCPRDGVDLDSVLRVADMRLYRSKGAGRRPPGE